MRLGVIHFVFRRTQRARAGRFVRPAFKVKPVTGRPS